MADFLGLPGSPKGHHDTQDKAVIHFLFLTQKGSQFIKYWGAWLATGGERTWKAWLYCQMEDSCRTFKDLPWLNFVSAVEATACQDMVSPMAQLVKAALTSPPHAKQQLDKYVFIGDGTLPVKPFSEVYAALTRAAVSDMCFKRRQEEFMRPTSIWGTSLSLVRTSQWVSLTRTHAERFAFGWDLQPGANALGQWQVPLRGEAFGKDMSVSASNFTCVDQDGDVVSLADGLCRGCGTTASVAVFATVQGALQEGSSGFSKFWDTDWTPTCRTFSSFFDVDTYSNDMDDMLRPELEQDFLAHSVMRAKHVVHWQDGPKALHIEKVTERTLSMLRVSDYLFAQQFSHRDVNFQMLWDITTSNISKFTNKYATSFGIRVHESSCDDAAVQWPAVFRCSHVLCVPAEARCNDIQDCSNGEDEVDCEHGKLEGPDWLDASDEEDEEEDDAADEETEAWDKEEDAEENEKDPNQGSRGSVGDRSDEGGDVPVLNLLFQTKSGLPLASYWRRLLDNASSSKWRAYLHCEDEDACSTSTGGQLTWLTVVPTVGSKYCEDLVSPMAQLVKYAVQDSRHDLDKFIFLSDSTLPVKPFSMIYDELTVTSKSNFCVKRVWSRLLTAEHNGTELFFVPVTQWSVLNLPHAKRFASGWPVDAAPVNPGEWQVPVNCRGTGLSEECETILSRKFTCIGPGGYKATMCRGCGPVDSVGVFATIFGAFPISAIDEDAAALAEGRNWSNSCGTFASFGDRNDKVESDEGVSHLASADDVEVHGHDKQHDDGSHPWTFDMIGARSIAAMRASKYLFMRKISNTSMLEDYEKLAFANDQDFFQELTASGIRAGALECRAAFDAGWEHAFQCSRGLCVPASARCNGIPDCDDKSDEQNCEGDGTTIDEVWEEFRLGLQGNSSRTKPAVNGTILGRVANTTHASSGLEEEEPINAHMESAALRSFGQPMEIV